jgi:ribosomal protein S21
VEQMIRKFARMCKEEGIIKEVRERSYFTSKSQRRRHRKHAAKMRHMKNDFKK